MTVLDIDLPRVTGFDFLVGDWAVANRRLREPLSGNEDWYETSAVATSRTLHNGAISVDEMWYPELGFAGTSFRICDRDTDEWRIYWVSSRDSVLQPPVSGRWEAGQLVATGDDTYDGRDIVARYRWHEITPTSATWEQAFSVDGGAGWETNWVMGWTRR